METIFVKTDKALSNSMEELKDGEFKLLFFILNTFNLNGTDDIVIYRELMADKTKQSVRQITRVLNSLIEKGFIEKTTYRKGLATLNKYALGSKLKTFKGDKNVPLGDVDDCSVTNCVCHSVQESDSLITKNVPLIEHNRTLQNLKEHSLFDKGLFVKEKNISVGYIQRESEELGNFEEKVDTAETVSSEDKTIPIENDFFKNLVEPEYELDELFAEAEQYIPIEETQNKPLGDVFSSDVDNYQGQGEKCAQNALKVPQIESFDPDKVWTYVGREYNGDKMTYQECVDRGLRYWCLQDVDTGEFCTSEYIQSISR